MKLYHRTTAKAAQAILRDSFRDGTGDYMTTGEYTGVWLSEVPLDINEGARGGTLLAVTLEIDETELARYEWVERDKPYREWLIPAAIVNRGRVEVVEVDDDLEAATNFE